MHFSLTSLLFSVVLAGSSGPFSQSQLDQDEAPAMQHRVPPPSDCSAKNLTLWDKHVCKAISLDVQPGCIPQKRIPDTNQKIKGIVVAFHGFSACPNAMLWLTLRLRSEGFVTLTPLTVGHGLKRFAGCNTTQEVCVDGFPTTDLPTRASGYERYLDSVTEILKQELSLIPKEQRDDNFQVGVIGNSLGGPLATIFTAKMGKVVTRLISVNGYYGMGDAGFDSKIRKCLLKPSPADRECTDSVADALLPGKKTTKVPESEDTPNRNILVTVFRYILSLPKMVLYAFTAPFGYITERKVKSMVYNDFPSFVRLGRHLASFLANSHFLIRLPILKQHYGWGSQCLKQTEVGRSGFCSFRIINLMAGHALGMNAIKMTKTFSKTTHVKWITVERDGPSILLTTYDIAGNLDKRKVPTSFCSYRTRNEEVCLTPTSTSNECGVPHACFNRREAKIVTPYDLYWEEPLLNDLVEYIKYGEQANQTRSADPRAICERIPLHEEDKHMDLFGFKNLTFIEHE